MKEIPWIPWQRRLHLLFTKGRAGGHSLGFRVGGRHFGDTFNRHAGAKRPEPSAFKRLQIGVVEVGWGRISRPQGAVLLADGSGVGGGTNWPELRWHDLAAGRGGMAAVKPDC